MFTLIGAGMSYVRDWLAIPVNWFLALSFVDWQLPVAVLLGVFLFHGRIVSDLYLASRRAAHAREVRKHDQMWNRVYPMSAEEFAADIDDMTDAAAHHEEQAAELEEKSDDPNIRFLPGARRSLLKRAATERARALLIRADIVELQLVRSHVLKEKGETPHSTLSRMIELASALNSTDERTAFEALVSLNALRNVSWSAAFPKELPPTACDRIEKCLNQMSGTGRLPEARNAFNMAVAILRQHSMQWEDLAA